MILRTKQPGLLPVRSFTLIELLVVISIIALLVSMLLPALSAARRQSKQATCLSHLKNLGTSSSTYESDDPNGLGIPVHPLMFRQCPEQKTTGYSNPSWIGAYEWGGNSGIGRPGFADGPATGEYAWITSRYGTKAGYGPNTRPLNDVLYPGGFKNNTTPEFDRNGAEMDTKMELEDYRCPADDGPPHGAHCPHWLENPDRSSYDHFGTSYSASVFLEASPETDAEAGIWSCSPYLRPMSRVPNPSRTLMYEENIGRWAWACRRQPEPAYTIDQWGGRGIDPGPTKAVRGWHGKDWNYNFAFTDGHAESIKILVEGTEDEEGYFEHYRPEFVVTNDTRSEWRTIDYLFHTIRGDGWQKDTFPSPRIRTGLRHGGHSVGRVSYEDCVTPDED